MIRVSLGFLIIITTFCPVPAYADGHYLLSRCQNALKIVQNPTKYSSRTDMAYCYGLLQGVREMNQLYQLKLKQSAYFCLDDQYLGHRESAELVVNFLRKHPEKLNKNETALVVQAFRDMYPCQG